MISHDSQSLVEHLNFYKLREVYRNKINVLINKGTSKKIIAFLILITNFTSINSSFSNDCSNDMILNNSRF